MTILFNCGEYPPMPSGGIGSVVKIIAEGLVKRGHNVIVAGYYYYQPACETHNIQHGVHIYNYSLGYHDSKLKCYLFNLLNKFHLSTKWIQHELDYYEDKLAFLIKKHNVDVLEMTDFYDFNNCTATLHYHRFEIPVIMRFHGSLYYTYANAGIDEPWTKINDLAHFNRADYFSYVSSYIRSFVRKMGADFDLNKECVINNMIEDEFLIGDKEQSDDKTILFFGKLIKTKGAFSTIKAFCEFNIKHPDWKLIMAGPAYTEALLDGVTHVIKKNIEFPGVCNRQQIKDLIDKSSFVCIPSFFEAFSMAALEVMARAKALIYTERTSGPEIIKDGENGVLVDPENVYLITEKMSLLADNTEIRDKIAKNAYNTIESKLCEHHILSKLENYYANLK